MASRSSVARSCGSSTPGDGGPPSTSSSGRLVWNGGLSIVWSSQNPSVDQPSSEAPVTGFPSGGERFGGETGTRFTTGVATGAVFTGATAVGIDTGRVPTFIRG